MDHQPRAGNIGAEKTKTKTARNRKHYDNAMFVFDWKMAMVMRRAHCPRAAGACEAERERGLGL